MKVIMYLNDSFDVFSFPIWTHFDLYIYIEVVVFNSRNTFRSPMHELCSFVKEQIVFLE